MILDSRFLPLNEKPLISETVCSSPSRRVITSTWWEGLVLPMIPRAMPAGAQAPGRATQAGKVKEEGRN
jgi:hypothetical protein